MFKWYRVCLVVVVAGLVFAWFLCAPWQPPEHDDTRLFSLSDLQRIGQAIESYHEAFKKYPPAALRDKTGKALLSWRVAILPLLDKLDLFLEFKLDEPWDSPHKMRLLEKMPTVYADWKEYNPTKTFYQVFTGPSTAFERDGLTKADFPDGLDKTLFVIQGPEAVPSTKPADLEYDPTKPLPALKPHYGISVFFGRRLLWYTPSVNAVFGDFRAYSIPCPVDDALLRGYITRNRGEDVPRPQSGRQSLFW